MKISRFYCNKPHLVGPITFESGLNVVMAEIRLPENLTKDTHNLGKSLLARMIDFGLLAGRDARFFLFKHHPLFDQFVFYLELELIDSTYVTIRRSVAEASKISFKKHYIKHQDFSSIAASEWDHQNLPFERAKELLDGLLDLRAIKPWSYRKAVGYLLRSQDDFRSVFHLHRFAGAHSDWKPFLAHVVGFDSTLVTAHYEKKGELSSKQTIETTLQVELGGSVEDISKIEGILLLKQQDAEKKQRLLDDFDFRAQDKARTRELVEQIDVRIAQLNTERYSLNHNKKKIIDALGEEQILFDPKEARRLFSDAGVLFEGQIVRDFEQLIAFNKAITEERRTFLEEELRDIAICLQAVNNELNTLGRQRSETLAFLSSTDVFGKYKQLSAGMVTLLADIETIQRQRDMLRRLRDLRAEIRALAEETQHLQAQIESDVERKNEDKSSRFSAIRLFFSEIVEEVIDRKALLSVSPNQHGHLEFTAEILDEAGNPTSAARGHSYHKLLCIAFDLAVLRAYIKDAFPRFVYHDGFFESLDDRKKENLLRVVRRYAEMGLQIIVTLIDSDLPARPEQDKEVFHAGEIVLTLHDENEQGRLFRMAAW